MAIKCALSLSVAFSCILGRAGPLECWFLTIIGTIGFELNRNIISNYGADMFGTFYVFAFGGAMGLTVSYLLKIRQDRKNATAARNNLYNGSPFSVSLALLGSLIIFVFFPIMAYDIDSNIDWTVSFTPYSAPLCILLAVASGFVGSLLLTVLINGKINIRDAVHGPISGGVAVGASALYITNPVYSILVGFMAGLLQTFIQNVFDRPSVRIRVVSTISWSLFLIQGLFGSAFAAGWRAIINNNTNGVALNPLALTK